MQSKSEGRVGSVRAGRTRWCRACSASSMEGRWVLPRVGFGGRSRPPPYWAFHCAQCGAGLTLYPLSLVVPGAMAGAFVVAGAATFPGYNLARGAVGLFGVAMVAALPVNLLQRWLHPQGDDKM